MAHVNESDDRTRFCGAATPSTSTNSVVDDQNGSPLAKKKPLYQRSSFWLVVMVVGLILLAGVSFATCAAQQYTIVYSVSGAGKADITYDSAVRGDNPAVKSATLSWSHTIRVQSFMDEWYLGAKSDTGATVTCTIDVNGSRREANTGVGSCGLSVAVP